MGTIRSTPFDALLHCEYLYNLGQEMQWNILGGPGNAPGASLS